MTADQPLTRESLPRILTTAGVDPSLVSLYGARDNDRIVIDNRPAGWVVFHTERGGEYDLRVHATEHEACEDALRRLGVVRASLPTGSAIQRPHRASRAVARTSSDDARQASPREVALRRGLAGWTFQLSGIPSSCLVLACVWLAIALTEPSRGGLWIVFAVFVAIGLTGFLVNTRLCACQLRWGFRWRPRRLDLRDVTALREGPTPSYRGYNVPGIVAELASGREVRIATSTHLGKRRRSRWMAAIEDARQTCT